MSRVLVFLYGVASYAVFFATFLYAIGFIGNIGVPKTIDSGRSGPLAQALLIDAGLLAAFALQHSIMARQWFKRAWTKVIPEPAERSTYVLASSLALIALFWFWQPLGGTIWHTDNQAVRIAMWSICALGFGIVLLSTFLINHFDLFGLRQVWLYLRGREYTHLRFRTPLFYKYVRHPLYVGWLLSFWATPTMTAAHLLFAVLSTGYILVAIRFEERDLAELHGQKYRRYQQSVPMLVPAAKAAAATTGDDGFEKVPA